MTSSPNSDVVAEKIQNPVLLEVITGAGSDEPTSVLVELDIPSQVIDFEKQPGPEGQRAAIRVKPESSEQQAQNEAKIKAAREFLISVLGETPQWLRSARAFVAQATPDQLRTIALSPLIRAIRLNRRLELSR
jgi:hypothetical protein